MTMFLIAAGFAIGLFTGAGMAQIALVRRLRAVALELAAQSRTKAENARIAVPSQGYGDPRFFDGKEAAYSDMATVVVLEGKLQGRP